jgi:hypothetical protein
MGSPKVPERCFSNAAVELKYSRHWGTDYGLRLVSLEVLGTLSFLKEVLGVFVAFPIVHPGSPKALKEHLVILEFLEVIQCYQYVCLIHAVIPSNH